MIRLRALGECAFDVGTERLGPEAELAFALLLVLVLSDGRRLSRQRVIDLLWPATTAERARHNLRQAIYKLRQLGVPLDTDPGHVRLAPQVVDASLVLPGAEEAPPAALLLRPDAPFGEFLAGYAPRFSAAFAAWVEEQRGVVHARLRRALLALLADERRRGSWGAVETLARKCLQIDPLNEEATMALAEATALTGSKRAAIALLDGYLEELGPGASELRLPVAVLRRRIAERVTPAASFAAAMDCFVGREASVAWLREQFGPTMEGRGRAALVWEDEGMGKSRLVVEFSRMAELDGARTVRVSSQPRDLERPLSAFVDLVPELQALPGALGCSPESFEYLRRLTDHDPAVLEPSAATREAELLYASVRRALFDLIDAVAGESPLVLCFEDTHWLDDRSWRVTRELAAWIAERPVLLLLTSRSPHGPAQPLPRPLPGLAVHRLPPLAQPAALALFAAVAGASAPPTAFRDWAVHVAAGNPFMIRALAAHWAETGEVRAPASLDALVAARVSRITGRALRTLQACAVLGRYATVGRLEAVLEYPRHELLEAATLLEECGMVAADGPAVPCRHELIARAALELLPDGTRRLLHRCAGEVLEREVRDARSAALLWACAQQWQAAGEQARALGLVRSCAGHLLEVGLPTEAAEAYERALELCETDAERVEMLGSLAQAQQSCGKWPQLIAALRELAAIRGRSNQRLAPPAEERAMELEARWRVNESLPPLLIEAEQILTDRNSSTNLRWEAAVAALIFADNLCDDTAARRIYEKAMQLQTVSSISERARLRVAAIYHSAYGDLAKSVQAVEEWIAFERRFWTRLTMTRALRNAATPLRLAGQTEQAFQALVEAFELACKYGLASAAANGADILATANLNQGDLENARRWYNEALRWLDTVDELSAGTSIQRVGARIALAEGDHDRARWLFAATRSALPLDSVARRRVEGYAIFTAIELAAGSHRLDEALLREFEEHYATACRFGGQDFATESLAAALCRLGQPARAQELLAGYLNQTRREQSQLPPSLSALCTAVSAPTIQGVS
jgi:DNA-binding SARP family transcriptional activator